MRVVSNRFRLQTQRWWEVNGKVIVPIWLVEFIRSHFQFGGALRQGPAMETLRAKTKSGKIK
jgi:hypothetical protein